MSADGCILRAEELTLPPSEYWSEEFRRFYCGMVAAAAQPALEIPRREAPKAEWDRYDAASEAVLAQPLAEVLARYPVEVEDTFIGGVHVGIVSARAGIAPENERRVLINLHGGGFMSNRGLSFGQLESAPVAVLGRIKVVTLDYRQAPFDEYPAASEDVEAVYRQLLEHYAPDAIGLYGCSAGGDLTAQALVRLQNKALPRPGAAGIFSYAPSIAPWFWGKAGDSRVWLFGHRLRSQPSPAEEAAMAPAFWYMQRARPDDAEAFPGSCEAALAKFPSTLLLVGTREYWASAAFTAHARFLHLGVDSSLYVMEGAPHGAHVMAIGTPEAHQANAYVARWFQSRLART